MNFEATTVGGANAPTTRDEHRTATRDYLDRATPQDLEAWRVADDVGRPSADERNLQEEFCMGWFMACWSHELAAGGVKPMRYFGKDLALWRGKDGVARVIDAYCAHYGAHMGIGGKVHGNLLECPFHAWRWDESGACREIPYAKRIPPQATRADCVPSWPTAEMNGMVMIWHHPDRVAPLWDPVDFDVVGKPGWTDFRTFEWRCFTSLESMADNAIDVSHFKYVHGAMTVPEYTFEFDGLKRSVLAYLKLATPRGEVNGQIASMNFGPGQGLVRFSGLSETMLISAVTPVERDEAILRFGFIQPESETQGARANLSNALIMDIVRQFDQDKVILDRHRRQSQPLVCDGDGPFGRNRVYYSQFYASSPNHWTGESDE